jgi:hypothetical protein
MFFGTPHQGSSLATYFQMVLRVVHGLAFIPGPKLVESLVKEADTLKRLTEEYLRHHERRPYEIVSFYECRGMKLIGMVRVGINNDCYRVMVND